MRILYIAKHSSGGNQDEDAITHALAALGHTVLRVHEIRAHRITKTDADFILFHKYEHVETLKRLGKPAIFYYFDLVDYPDPTLEGRNQTRRQWMADMLPHVAVGFCSDGDWVAKDKTGKLVYLTQGADERVTGFGKAVDDCQPPILFTGIRNGGRTRASFVDEMAIRYGETFRQVRTGLHGRELADAIAGAKIVVAPDGPVTDRYWSNRVYLTLGFGGFLLHPYCEKLAEHYQEGKEIVFYQNRRQLHELIRYYYEEPDVRKRIATAGLQRTIAEHLYRHRIASLIRIVQERIL